MSSSALPLRRAAVVSACVALAASAAALGVPASASPLDGDCPAMTPLSHTSTNAPVVRDETLSVVAGSLSTVPVLANDTDADGDQLALVKVDQPTKGLTCGEANGTVDFLSLPTTTGYTESFGYAVTDGDYYRSGKVTVTVAPDSPVVASVVRRLRGSHQARLRITNHNTRPVRLLLGSSRAKNPSVRRTIAPGATVSVTTSLSRVVYLASLRVAGVGGLPLTLGRIDTRTGRVRTQDVSDIFVGRSSQAAVLAAGRSVDPWR